MFCRNCGHEVKDGDTFCSNCGAFVDSNNTNETNYNSIAMIDRGNPLLGVLSFFIPIMGLILYIIWKKEKPRTAKHVGIGALVFVIMFAGSFLLTLLGFLI